MTVSGENVVRSVLDDLVAIACDYSDAPVVVRRNRSKKQAEFRTRCDSLYSVEEDEDEENAASNNKPKKPILRGWIETFRRTKKHSASTNDLATLKLPSLKKKLTHFFHTDAPQLLKRSFSFRDLSQKLEVEKAKKRLAQTKQAEWRNSLHNLTINDFGISYDDLSLIDYDSQNAISYRRAADDAVDDGHDRIRALRRSQSVNISGVHPHHSHSQRNPINYNSCSNLFSNQTDSLQSLRNGFISNSSLESASLSVSEDNWSWEKRSPHRDETNEGKRNRKLRRNDATAKIHPQSPIPREEDRKEVRSRSLNNLQDVEKLRHTAHCPSPERPPLKDASSEPNCTGPILQTPSPSREAPPRLHMTPLSSSTPSPRTPTFFKPQRSSDDCISVSFEIGNEAGENEILVPAIRGETLHDALAWFCERNALDLSTCSAWLQDRDNVTYTQILLGEDAGHLIGRHVRVVASSRKSPGIFSASHSRKPSTSGGKTRSSTSFSVSGDDNVSITSTSSLQENEAAKKQYKQRWSKSGLFGTNKDARMETLAEQLNGYERNGIPVMVQKEFTWESQEALEALYLLEGDWKDLIDPANISDKVQQQQTAVWELIQTEAAYIKTLKVVTDLFIACLRSLQSANLLKEIDTAQLFSNIDEILVANITFWSRSLYPLIREMRHNRDYPKLDQMLDGFMAMNDTFHAYFRFCGEQARCQHYCRENNVHNELFTAYLAWCETRKECNRLRLQDILVQPMQRLTKYGLLLKAILRNTADEREKTLLNHADLQIRAVDEREKTLLNNAVRLLCIGVKSFDSTLWTEICEYEYSMEKTFQLKRHSFMRETLIRAVDEFVNRVNSSLKEKQDSERISGIKARIESYDIIESKDDDLEKLVKSYSSLDLEKPMEGCHNRRRHLLLEGDLKLKDNLTSKTEVHCFLLTDLLLICKPSTKKGNATMRVIRQPYFVDRLEMLELNRETPSLALIYKNELDMAVAAFILQNNDAKKLKCWKDGLTKARNLYLQAKQQSLPNEGSFEMEYYADSTFDEYSLQPFPRSPIPSSSRASRVSSLAHSNSGSMEMNDQSVGSTNQSRGISVEAENRPASASSEENVQSLPPDKSPGTQQRTAPKLRPQKTPNTLTVGKPYVGSFVQSLPNLPIVDVACSPASFTANTLSVPTSKAYSSHGHAHAHAPPHPRSPTKGESYPPPSPQRGNLTRAPAISHHNKNPLLKTKHVTSTIGTCSVDYDVPAIAGTTSLDSSHLDPKTQHAIVRKSKGDEKLIHSLDNAKDLYQRDDGGT